MKKSTFLGSVVSVLLAFSVISDARTYVQQQDPKPVQQTNQTVNTQSNTPAEATRPETSATQLTDSRPAATEAANAGTIASPNVLTGNVVVPGEVYSATAYSLRGRTASGRPVARGVIAADPRVLPIGTRVLVEAGAWSGEYVVADTGGAVRGRRIDIWTPTSGEAMRFGRRAVKLTVLEVGGKRARTAPARQRLVNSPNASSSTEAQATRQ
jgi:3D (Asp-Asp-Asp) domain-containing protein